MAPARSIQCMRRPPSSAFRGLASFGRTISAISEVESHTGRGVRFAWSWSLIECLLFVMSASALRRSEQGETLARSIGLEIASCEFEHAWIPMWIEPNLADQIEDQF